MELNFLSVSQIMRHNPQLAINFRNHKCYIVEKKTKKIVALGVEDHGLFKLVNIGHFREHALVAKSASYINTLCHQWYGHLNLTHLSQLAQENLVDGLSDIQQQIHGVWGTFLVGKQHRAPFDEGQTWRAQRVLQLVHANIFGPMNMTSITNARMPFPSANCVEAVLFDVDGTLVDSDPLHYLTFRDMLQEVGFQGGDPITEEFFSKNISGKHNDYIGAELFPDWDESQRKKFLDDKEALFRRKAVQNLKPVDGLHKLCKWIENRGLRRAAVTNAPRENAELMISIVGLTDFFEFLVIGSECERAKPFPDPYLKALEHFNIPSSRAFALEDSPSGVKAAVAAGLSVVGLTTRNPGQELIDAGATFLIKDFENPDLWNALAS